MRRYAPNTKLKDQNKKLDSFIYIAVFLEPLMTIPQVYDIWVGGEKGASLATWVAYLAFAVMWLVYGIIRNIKPIIYAHILWIIFELAIVIGLLSHR